VEKAQRVWWAELQKAWLRDHPGKTIDDYELAGSCGDTDEGEQAFHRWYDEWAVREGEAIRRRLFGLGAPGNVTAVAEVADQAPAESGAVVLADVEKFLGRFVVYPSEHARVAHVLWDCFPVARTGIR
jgi:hypothetical protein